MLGLQALIDDTATIAQINAPLPGGELITYSATTIILPSRRTSGACKPNFTLTYGIRYETPGNPIDNLATVSQRILKVNGNDPRYLAAGAATRQEQLGAPRGL